MDRDRPTERTGGWLTARVSLTVQAAALLLLVAGGCEINVNNPAGFDFTGRGPATVLTDTVSATGADTSWAVDSPLHTGNRLFVGRHLDFEAVALLRFLDLPADAVIDEARLTFYRAAANAAGEDPSGLTLSLLPVTVDWDTTWTGDRLGELTFDPLIDSISIPYTVTVDTFGFDLPAVLVQAWSDDPTAVGTRRGVAVTAPSDAPWLVQLDAGDDHFIYSQRRPRLRIRWHPAAGGSSRIAIVYPEVDLSLVELTGSPAAGELWVARGVPWRTLVTFDLSVLPDGATVNRAVLRLPLLASDQIGLPVVLAAGLPSGPDPWNYSSKDLLETNTVSSGIAVIEGDSTVAILVTRAVAAYLRGTRSQTGLLVLAVGESDGITRLRLGDTTVAAEERARLEVVYAVPPGGAQ